MVSSEVDQTFSPEPEMVVLNQFPVLLLNPRTPMLKP